MDLKKVLNRKKELEKKIPDLLEENESLKKVKIVPSFEHMLKAVEGCGKLYKKE